MSLALLATACGSGGDDTKDGAKSGTKKETESAAPAAPAKGRTDAELKGLLVTQAELPDHKLDPTGNSGVDQSADAPVETDKPECKVLTQVHAAQKIGSPTGNARAVVSAKSEKPKPGASVEEQMKAIENALGVTVSMVGLHSYDGKGAEELTASFKNAGEACAGGFTMTSNGDKTKVTSVKEGPAVTGGDEALSLELALDLEGKGKPTALLLSVVRKGNTVASFSALSLVGKTVTPTAVINTQVKKLP
ncbi:hypothetical protein ACM614_00540 [Streptomyces sp. 12297]